MCFILYFMYDFNNNNNNNSNSLMQSSYHMFNVSSLLLDYALEPATPLTKRDQWNVATAVNNNK